MSRLINRDVVVTIGEVRIAARPKGDDDLIKPTLRVIFKVDRTRNRDTNSAEVSTWNLARKTRSLLQEENIGMIIEAGYVGSIRQIFSGDVANTETKREAVNWITTVQSGDGLVAYRSARLSESFGPGTGLGDVLKKLTRGMGIGLGNALEKIGEGNFRGGLTEFTTGLSVAGRVSDQLDRFLTTAGFEWSIQDGQLQVLRPGEATEVPDDEVVKISKESGLVGSPEVGEKGIVKARSLLQGDIVPGRPINIEAAEVNGFFRVDKVVHTGDTWGSDWFSDLEATPL